MHDVTAIFLCCASFCGVTALTADRFLAIHFHLRYQELVTHKRIVAVVTSSWVLCSIISPLWLWNPKIFSTVAGIIATVCLIFTAFFYWKIYLAVQRHANHIQVLQVQQVAQTDEVMVNAARQIKSAVSTFYVFLVFSLCFLPYISINVVKTITGRSTLLNTLREYTVTLVFLNSSLNPLVYSWRMRPIRYAITSMLRNMFPKRKKLTKTASYN